MPLADSNRVKSVLRFLKKYGRWLLLVLGSVAVFFLVRDAGVDRVLDVIASAAPWLPLIVLLEVAWISMDAVALWFMYKEASKRVPVSAWLRSSSLAYGVMVLLPAGRAGGEVARAAHLSKYVGMLSGTAAAQLQGSTLFANFVISIPCYIAVSRVVGFGHQLSWLVLLNGLATAFLGIGIMFVSSRSQLGQKLGRRFSFLKPFAEQLDEASVPLKAFPKRAVLCTVFGRMLQTLQYGVILTSIGGHLSVGSAFVAQGIHLVGSGLGDMVPNAVGITEGVYRYFAASLGFASEPARAISIALVARLVQYSLAAAALIFGSARFGSPAEGKEG